MRVPEVPDEARRLWFPTLESRAPTSADSEPWRGPVGPLGELGPRPPREGLGQAYIDKRVQRACSCSDPSVRGRPSCGFPLVLTA
eukprot:2555579-Alexandrium_andersonii.AAC.1